MRIVQVAVLFTMLFITRGGCRPNTVESEYPNDTGDGDDYDEDVKSEDTEDRDTNYSDPYIHTKPLRLLTSVGETVELPCNVSNSQEVAVTWQKGALQLYVGNIADSTVDVRRISVANNNSLIIRNFMDSDVSDDYICSITTDPPQSVVHSIRTSPHLFILPSDRIEVDEPNTNLTLACIANWKPQPKIRWYHGGKQLASEHLSEDGSSLAIYNVTDANAGLYQCFVENKPSDTEPKLYPIYVLAHHAPRITVENEIVHTGIHLDAELSCQVDAYPTAQVTWFKNGKKVTVGGQNKKVLPNHHTTHTLVFSRPEKSDFGKYTCEATNIIGTTSRIIELTGAPREAKLVQVYINDDGTVPILEWQVQSESPILKYELEFRRKGDKDWQIAYPRASDDGTRNIFKVKYPLEGLKEGSYEAVLLAQNEYGWSPRPRDAIVFKGAGSKSGAASIQSLIILRSLLLAASLLVCTTYL